MELLDTYADVDVDDAETKKDDDSGDGMSSLTSDKPHYTADDDGAGRGTRRKRDAAFNTSFKSSSSSAPAHLIPAVDGNETIENVKELLRINNEYMLTECRNFSQSVMDSVSKMSERVEAGCMTFQENHTAKSLQT